MEHEANELHHGTSNRMLGPTSVDAPRFLLTSHSDMVDSKVKPGQCVILRSSKGSQIVYRIPDESRCEDVSKERCTSSTREEKIKIPLNLLIGSQLYSVFRHDGKGNWRVVPEEQLREEQLIDHEPTEDMMEEDVTNQKLEDSNSSQNLSSVDIGVMKAAGVDPQTLIGTIIENSTSFEGKTKFSQVKYIKKKLKKHLEQYTLLPTSLVNISETYGINEFKRIAGLRYDYLSTMLNASYVRPGSRVLLLDQTSGLLTAAVLQRLAGVGQIYKVGGDLLSSKIVHEMNFPESYFDIIRNVPISLLEIMIKMTPAVTDLDNFAHPIRQHIWIKPPHSLDEAPIHQGSRKRKKRNSNADHAIDAVTFPTISENENEKDSSEAALFNSNDNGRIRRQQSQYLARQNKRADELKEFIQAGVDVVLVALSPYTKIAGYSAEELGKILLKACDNYLNPDGRLALFSLNHSLVLSCQLNLLKKPPYLGIRFEELFLREYQVLPFRTHPQMGTSIRHFTGFLLTAIKIENDEKVILKEEHQDASYVKEAQNVYPVEASSPEVVVRGQNVASSLLSSSPSFGPNEHSLQMDEDKSTAIDQFNIAPYDSFREDISNSKPVLSVSKPSSPGNSKKHDWEAIVETFIHCISHHRLQRQDSANENTSFLVQSPCKTEVNKNRISSPKNIYNGRIPSEQENQVSLPSLPHMDYPIDNQSLSQSPSTELFSSTCQTPFGSNLALELLNRIPKNAFEVSVEKSPKFENSYICPTEPSTNHSVSSSTSSIVMSRRNNSIHEILLDDKTKLKQENFHLQEVPSAKRHDTHNSYNPFSTAVLKEQFNRNSFRPDMSFSFNGSRELAVILSDPSPDVERPERHPPCDFNTSVSRETPDLIATNKPFVQFSNKDSSAPGLQFVNYMSVHANSRSIYPCSNLNSRSGDQVPSKLKPPGFLRRQMSKYRHRSSKSHSLVKYDANQYPRALYQHLRNDANNRNNHINYLYDYYDNEKLSSMSNVNEVSFKRPTPSPASKYDYCDNEKFVTKSIVNETSVKRSAPSASSKSLHQDPSYFKCPFHQDYLPSCLAFPHSRLNGKSQGMLERHSKCSSSSRVRSSIFSPRPTSVIRMKIRRQVPYEHQSSSLISTKATNSERVIIPSGRFYFRD